jgi:hypothetical protein
MSNLKDRSCTLCGTATQAYSHEKYPFCLNCVTLGKAFEYIKKVSIKSVCVKCNIPVETGVLVRTKGLLCNGCYSSHMISKGLKSQKTAATERESKMSEQNAEEVSAEEVSAEAPQVKKKRTVVRLGQTKLIDKLLKDGKTDEQVLEEVKTQIPQYPAEKIPQLIKIRKAHLKKAQQTTA